MTGIWGSKGYTLASRSSDFLRSVLQNGSGRYVQQLQRLTLRFCQKSIKSKQARDFVESSLVGFAKQNPGIVFYVTPESDIEPKICAEYINGRSEFINLVDLTENEILMKCNELKSRSGLEIVQKRKNFHTDFPSIQGEWTPFTNLKNYTIKYSPRCSTVEPKDAWERVKPRWRGLYRKHELHKLETIQKLTYTEREEQPLGKWGPKLKHEY